MKDKIIPSGWYFCAESSEVKSGQVIAKALFGKNLILWRTNSGVLQISDAVCPHWGRELGKRGMVRGEYLLCFPHKYTYNSNGDCVSSGFKTFPYRNKKGLRHLPVHEVEGFILAWYDANGRKPLWRIPKEVFDIAGTTINVCFFDPDPGASCGYWRWSVYE